MTIGRHGAREGTVPSTFNRGNRGNRGKNASRMLREDRGTAVRLGYGQRLARLGVTVAVAALALGVLRSASAATVTVDMGSQTATQVAKSLVGSGVTISNVTFKGDQLAGGTFSGALATVGFNEGVILSTGNIADSVGPNEGDSTTTQFLTPGDADLTTLSGFPTLDATVLEFDFVPDGDKIFFRYVFGSEEYNEYVNTEFNDSFGFFINGTNCATVATGGGGTLPVSVNTINNGNPFGVGPVANPSLYRNNDVNDPAATIDSEMDGLTVVLTCTASVNPNVQNHMKLAIADASDDRLDSVVFIEKGSLSTKPPATGPDLSVKKELKPGQPAPSRGGRLFYLVRVQNIGAKATPPAPAVVTLLDTPPAGTTITSWGVISGSGRCSLDGLGRLSCDLGGNLAPGAEVVVEVVIRTPQSGQLTNTAEVDPFNRIAEGDESNNKATLLTVIP